jgi:nitrous oxidase accessory protein
MTVNRLPLVLLVLTLMVTVAAARAAAPLQLFIDLTAPGKTLKLTPGTYAGPAVIDKPMVLDGLGEATIDGGGKGSVLTITADGVMVRGCRIVGSGNSHDTVDAAILLKAGGALIEDNRLEDVLFGVHVSGGNDNTIRGNDISSRQASFSLRGEGIRLWYASGNLIEDNNIHDVRDMVLTNSPDNIIRGNRIHRGRMGMEMIYSPGTEIVGNHLDHNEHGIVAIYSDRLHIHGNRIEHQGHLQGSGIAIKASAGCVIESNGIIDCAVGLTANSPIFAENILFIRDNTFAYNDVAMYFYGEKGGHIISGNLFFGNFQQVAVSGPTSALDNEWSGNIWQDYQGFDRDGDGFGDTPYCVLLYADRLWMDRPMAKFFRGSLMLEAVDFVERLAPLSEPWLILRDPKPRMDGALSLQGLSDQE